MARVGIGVASVGLANLGLPGVDINIASGEWLAWAWQECVVVMTGKGLTDQGIVSFAMEGVVVAGMGLAVMARMAHWHCWLWHGWRRGGGGG
jgi:hypothetical protein